MAEQQDEAVLVLADMAGNIYVLTRDALERARIAGELAVRVQERLSDVSGFAPAFRVLGTVPAGVLAGQDTPTCV
jgi:hypothetical protein